MASLGFFSLPWSGHLNPLCALAGELKARGHEVAFFHLPEFRPEVESRGFSFRSYGEGLFPEGTFAERDRRLRGLRGLPSAEFALGTTRMCGEALLSTAREVIESSALDLWVVDHLDYAASILARSMGAPFVTAITTLMRHSEQGVPGFSGEIHGSTSEPDGLSRLVQPWRDTLDRHSRQAGLGPFSYGTIWSALAQITQQPREFEYPRKSLPDCFHFTGPFISEITRPPVPFPWERLDGSPLVYASLGSVGQGNLTILKSIVQAVKGLGVQLVVAAGEFARALEDTPEVVALPTVPQLQILERASIMIHHAGMNSSLECLAAGVPMLVLPLASDQPGIAKRVEWSGVGIDLSSRDYSAESIRVGLEEILQESRYRLATERFRDLLRARRGLQKAASIVEKVLETGRPVV